MEDEHFTGLTRPRRCEALDAEASSASHRLGALPHWMRPLLAHKRAAKLAWVSAETLPALYVRETGERLPVDASRALVQALQYATASAGHSSLHYWREYVEPSSAGRFVEALARRWDEAVIRGEGRAWALWASRLLGDEQSLATVAMSALSPERTPEEIELIVSVLQLSGMWGEILLSVLAAHPREALSERASAKIARALLDRVHQSWDTSIHELLDAHERLAHALGVDTGGRDFPLGGDVVSVELDPYGSPLLIGAAGDGQPPAEDVEALERFDRDAEAITLWFALESLERLVEQQADVFERMMVERASWSWQEWRALFLENRVFASWSRGVLWEIQASDAPESPWCFRVCEDHTLADIEDEELSPDPSWRVAVAYPAYLPREVRATWMEIFASYERLAPFDQLGQDRDVMTSEEIPHELRRLVGAVLDIRALRKRRWKRTLLYEAFESSIPQTNIYTPHMVRVLPSPSGALFLGLGFQAAGGEPMVIRTFLRRGGMGPECISMLRVPLERETLIVLTEALQEVARSTV